MGILPAILTCTAVLLALLPSPTLAKGFRHLCPLSQMPIVTIVVDPATGNHSVVDGNGDDALVLSQEGAVVYQGQECFCAHWIDDGRSYYCPLGSGDTCGVSVTSTSTTDSDFGAYESYVGCFNYSRATQFSRNVWPVVLVLLAIASIALFATKAGRSSIRYVMSFCCPVYCNEGEVDRRLRREILRRDRRREVVSSELRRTRREVGWVRGYVLKTKTYDPSENLSGEDLLPERTKSRPKRSEGDFENNDERDSASDGIEDDDDGHLCTICLLGLEVGDRIGDLPCGHCFHIECLKPWIRRRNVCPLCQLEDIASEDRRFEEEEALPNSSGEGGDNGGEPTAGVDAETSMNERMIHHVAAYRVRLALERL